MRREDIRLRTPERRQMWNNLALTMSQAAALTGASERQIQHWMDRGYIAPATRGTRKLNGETLDLIVLIREARRQGVPLPEAVSLARNYLAGEVLGSLDVELAPTFLRELDSRLDKLRTEVETAQDMVRRAERSEE